MPKYSTSSSYSDSAPSPLWDVIDVDFLNSSFTCAGYAPSQHRRCYNPINISNRGLAKSMLAKADKVFQQGHCVEELLSDLAPVVLCKRNHQSQAGSLVDSWMEMIDDYDNLQSQKQKPKVSTSKKAHKPKKLLPSPSTPRRISSTTSSIPHSESTVATRFDKVVSPPPELSREIPFGLYSGTNSAGDAVIWVPNGPLLTYVDGFWEVSHSPSARSHPPIQVTLVSSPVSGGAYTPSTATLSPPATPSSRATTSRTATSTPKYSSRSSAQLLTPPASPSAPSSPSLSPFFISPVSTKASASSSRGSGVATTCPSCRILWQRDD